MKNNANDVVTTTMESGVRFSFLSYTFTRWIHSMLLEMSAVMSKGQTEALEGSLIFMPCMHDAWNYLYNFNGANTTVELASRN